MSKISASWVVEGDQSQIVIKYGGERSGKLTLWLRKGFTGDRNGQGVDVESAEEERGKSGFGEHDDRDCREREQITTAPGLELRGV